MKEIDARGLACPAPVLMAKAAVENEGAPEVTVLVDNAASQQNVQRFLESRGFETLLAQEGDNFRVTGRGNGKPQAAAQPAAAAPAPGARRLMVMAATDRIGAGDDVLGKKLMVNFIRTLNEMGPDLWRLVFVNSGVSLTIDDSPVLDALKALKDAGVIILVCGTCLDHFKLLERKQVGVTTNMLDIVTAMQLADSVINL
ncbi:MAG: sulfurtransferase-like selenium metabolism protein YedF [Pseudomonadota bacterium]